MAPHINSMTMMRFMPRPYSTYDLVEAAKMVAVSVVVVGVHISFFARAVGWRVSSSVDVSRVHSNVESPLLIPIQRLHKLKALFYRVILHSFACGFTGSMAACKLLMLINRRAVGHQQKQSYEYIEAKTRGELLRM